jgi:PAS domain S-box-containing protein
MVGIFVLDSKFSVVCVNQAIEHFFGIRKEDIIGKDKKELICEHIKGIFEKPEIFKEKVIATYDNNTYVEDFECHVLSEGKREERYLEHISMPIMTGAYKGGRIEQYIDITERRKMENKLIDLNAKLQESEKRFRIIFEKAGLGIMLLENNRPIISNPAFIRMLGYTERELHNMNVEDITHPDDIAKELLLTDDFLSGKIDAFQIEKRYIRKDGKVIFGNLIVSRGKDDKFGVAIIKDITERKKMEDELRKLNIKLQEQDNMKSEFVSIVSHEIRTPLSIILGFASIINKRFKNIIVPNVNVVGSKVEESLTKTQNALDLIISESNRLSNILHDLLDIAKIESGTIEWNMKDVSVVEVVERAIKVTTSLFEQNSLEIIKDFEDKLPVIVADKDRLVQVMINLITNAIKSTNKGSITCRISKQDSEIVVSVIDTGMGIEGVDQEEIFAKFSQVRKTIAGKQKGTGLGLSICQHVVESHGGRIWVESEPGKGSTFSFTLPL